MSFSPHLPGLGPVDREISGESGGSQHFKQQRYGFDKDLELLTGISYLCRDGFNIDLSNMVDFAGI